MARRKTVHPVAAFAWLTEASWVFAMHSAQLWADPARAGRRLAVLGAEKQKAFAEGAVKAGAAALRGARPSAVAKAALAPAKRRVRANAWKIQKG
jgi:high-affinity K+ transport system ATPase subunit B